MVEPESWAGAFSKLLPAVSDVEAKRLIRKIEVGLSMPEWRNNRIQFLRQSSEMTDDPLKKMAYRTPITQKKMRVVAEKGLVEAWKNSVVNTKEIGALMNDIKALQMLGNILLEAKGNGCLAKVWGNTFVSPDELANIRADLEKVFAEGK